jgi:hypothetical protein
MYTGLTFVIDGIKIEFEIIELLGLAQSILENAKTYPIFIPQVDSFSKLIPKFDKLSFDNFRNLIKITSSLTIPLRIRGIDSPQKWLYVVKKLAESESSLMGWWCEIGGQLLCIKNDPNDYHLYTSDYGPVDNVKEDTLSHVFKEIDWTDSKLVELIIQKQQDFDSLKKKKKEKLTSKLMQSLTTSRLEEIKKWHPDLSHQEAEIMMQNLRNDPNFRKEQMRSTYNSHHYIFKILYNKYKELKKLNPDFENAIYRIVGSDEEGKSLAKKIIKSFVLRSVSSDVNEGKVEPLFRPIEAYGKSDRGECYRAFYDSMNTYLTNHPSTQELAQKFRQLLNNQRPENCPNFLPNLIICWFISESCRNPISFMTTLMLIDLIKSNAVYEESGQNLYTWPHTLVHPDESIKEGKKYKNKKGGMLSMCHQDAVTQAKIPLVNIKPGTELNHVHEKDGHLLVDWLFLAISRIHPDVIVERNISIPGKKTKTTSIANSLIIEELLSKKQKQSEKIDQTINIKKRKDPNADISAQEKNKKDLKSEIENLQKKIEVCDRFIKPLLEKRVSFFENMLTADAPAKSAHKEKMKQPSKEEFSQDLTQRYKSPNNEAPDLELEEAKRQSLDHAKKSGIIGPRMVVNWVFHDVDDKGNCFYEATAHQMHQKNIPLFVQIGTLPRDVLRLHVQGRNFNDRDWADHDEIVKVARSFNLIVAIFKTFEPDLGYSYYYIDDNDEIRLSRDLHDIRRRRHIIELAYTNNHYLSILERPAHINQHIYSYYRPPCYSQAEASLFSRINTESMRARQQHEHDKQYGLILRSP